MVGSITSGDWWCSRRLNVAPLPWCSFLHWQSTCNDVTVSVFYPLTQVGKRRGGVFLKTGMVAKKQKQETEVSDDTSMVFFVCLAHTSHDNFSSSFLQAAEPGKSDAWSKYMAEVKKYKAHQCGDDDKTRPLVK